MFRVFQYFIFQVSGSLLDYDPAQDMLLTSGRFLTYRRFDQTVPTNGKLYAGAIKDRSDAEWMIWRFNNGLYQSGVGEWLEHLSYGGTSIGPWYPSDFRGVFAPLPRSEANRERNRQKLRKLEEFFRVYLNGQDSHFDSGHGPIDDKRWKYVVDWMLPSLVDARGQLLKSASSVVA